MMVKLRIGVAGVLRSLLNRMSRVPSKRPIMLSTEQKTIVDLLNTSSGHLFITGKAGSGKSVVLEHFVSSARDKNIIKVAPTGIAATHIGGQTIHTTFRLPIGLVQPHLLRLPKPARLLLRAVDIIVVDEISMVRADVIDGIDKTMRLAKGNAQPFGGVRFIAFGDLYQLPPVVSDEYIKRYLYRMYEGPHFFNAHVWSTAKLEVITLSESFRQTDEQFLATLNAIRDGSFSDDDISYINNCSVQPEKLSKDNSVVLTTTVAASRKINEQNLARLPGKMYVYQAASTGEVVENSLPVDEELRLKKGAQVIFAKNDPDKRWVNGDTGIVQRVSKTKIWISRKGCTYELQPETWEQTKYFYDDERQTLEQTIVGAFTQFPIRLAWAVTIHKSQGQTYDQVVVDLRNEAFAPGQVYVALSRCKHIEGLRILGELEKDDIIIDPIVAKFIIMATRLNQSVSSGT